MSPIVKPLHKLRHVEQLWKKMIIIIYIEEKCFIKIIKHNKHCVYCLKTSLSINPTVLFKKFFWNNNWRDEKK